MPKNKPRHMKLGKRSFLFLESLSTHGERYKARDLDASPGGELRAVHALQRSKRMLQHVRALQRVSENNRTLPAILSYHLVRDKIYLVLPWIKGPTLAQYLERCQRSKQKGLSPFEAVRLFHGFAHGLTNLHHHANIVHGDLKPQNIILCRDPSHLTLIDFGTAWLVEQTTMRQDGDGSIPQYTAPELLSGSGIGDFRSDRYSASVILYQMLTFKLPFDGAGGNAGVDPDSKNSGYKPPSKESRYRDQLPRYVWAKIDDVVRNGLKLDPNDRFPNRGAWLDALGAMKSEMERSTRLGTVNRTIVDFLDAMTRKVLRRS